MTKLKQMKIKLTFLIIYNYNFMYQVYFIVVKALFPCN